MIKIVRVPFNKPGNPCCLEIPKDSRILAVSLESIYADSGFKKLGNAMRLFAPYLWVEVDTDKPMVEQWFHMVEFNEELPPSCQLGKYIDAIKFDNGLVLHVYAVEAPF